MYQNITKANWRTLHTTIASADMIDIATPLKKLNIVHFSNISIYRDNSCYVLTTHPSFSKLFIDEKFYKIGLAGSYDEYQNSYFITDNITDQTIFSALKEHCNLYSGFVIVKKDKFCCDFYHFYSTANTNNSSMNLFFLNNIDFFERFIYDYRNKAKKLISLANNDRFIYPGSRQDPSEFSTYHNENYQSIIDELAYNNVINSYVSRNFTQKEQQTLNLLLKGYSTKEIARDLFRSPRTIEKHIIQLKNKFDVRSVQQLIAHFVSNGA